METRRTFKKLILFLVATLILSIPILSLAENITYEYDDLSRLIRIVYDDGKLVEYSYDEVGNRTLKISTAGDFTVPTTTASPTGGTFTSAQSVTLTCNDGTGSGCDKIYYTTDGTTPTTSSTQYSTPISISATTTLKFFARDMAGNSETVKSQTYTIDNILPIGTITINSGAASTNSASVTLTLTCSDAVGCSMMRFNELDFDLDTPMTEIVPFSTTKAWDLGTGDGIRAVWAQFQDAAQNWSTPVAASILLDTVAPATALSADTNTPQSITLACNDSGSGCDKIYYTTDGTTPTTLSTVYSAPIIITTATTLKYFAKDMAGNSETVKSQACPIIDNTLPIGTISINSGAVSTRNVSVTLSLTCSDAVGCLQMQFSNDNVSYSAAELFNATKAWTLPTGNGNKTVYVKFEDIVGNWSTAYSSSILLDRMAPTVTASPTGGTYNGTQTVTLTCNDGAGSGCDKIYYKTDGSNPSVQAGTLYTGPITISNSYNLSIPLKFFAIDKAGNWSTMYRQNYIIR